MSNCVMQFKQHGSFSVDWSLQQLQRDVCHSRGAPPYICCPFTSWREVTFPVSRPLLISFDWCSQTLQDRHEGYQLSSCHSCGLFSQQQRDDRQCLGVKWCLRRIVSRFCGSLLDNWICHRFLLIWYEIQGLTREELHPKLFFLKCLTTWAQVMEQVLHVLLSPLVVSDKAEDLTCWFYLKMKGFGWRAAFSPSEQWKWMMLQSRHSRYKR